MFKRPVQKRPQTGENRLAALLLSLLPAAMILGLLAPDVVETQLVAAQSQVVPLAAERVPWQPRSFKTPLLRPSELISDSLALGNVADLLERFARAVSAGPPDLTAPEAESLPGFEDLGDDSIVIEDVDEYVAEEIFENTLAPSLEVDSSNPWPAFADTISFNFQDFAAYGGFTQFDDFVGRDSRGLGRPRSGGTPVIPEPSTGGLLALGLVLLALHSRARA